MLIPFFVLIRIISNPFSNLFQKKLVANKAAPVFIIFVTHILLSIVSIPLIPKIFYAEMQAEFFLYMTVCAIFAVSSNVVLVKALGVGDLSLLGPINSYKPVVGMIFGIFLLKEIPSLLGLLGISFIIIGSYFIVEKHTGALNNFIFNKGVQLRFAALLLSGIEAIFLKKTLEYASPLVSMGAWCLAGLIFSGIFSAVLLRNKITFEFPKLIKNKNIFLLLFITTAAMQYTTLLVFENMQVSYALALFQTSALISVLLGHKYFKEKNIKNRIIGSVLMIIGSTVIILYG